MARYCFPIRCLLLWSIFTAVSGLLGIFFAPMLYNVILKKNMLLTPDTAAFEAWSKSPIPVLLKVYLFSVQNPEGILIKGEKPHLKEMGPFTFREEEEKAVIAFNKNNGTVTYKIRRRWFFQAHLSEGSLEDVVTTINFPALASAFGTKGGSYFMQLGIASTLDALGTEAFVKVKASQLLFEGYPDQLTSLGNMLGYAGTLDEERSGDRFGWFFERNGTTWSDGVFNMFTGETDQSRQGQIHTWNYRERTDFPGRCGRIHGSASGFFPPQSAGEHLDLFTHQACRTLRFHYKSDVTRDGLLLRTYKLDETAFGNSSLYNDDDDDDDDDDDGQDCYNNDHFPRGVQNLTDCGPPSPLAMSFPHFYLADPFYATKLADGSVRPDANRHESYIRAEPSLTLPQEIMIRLQLNVQLEPYPNLAPLAGLPSDVLLPVLWFEAHAAATTEISGMIRTLVNMPDLLLIVSAATLALGLAGLLCLLVGTLVLARRRRKLGRPGENENDDDRHKNGPWRQPSETDREQITPCLQITPSMASSEAHSDEQEPQTKLASSD